MFDSQAVILDGARHRASRRRTGGVAGNARLTGAAAALFVLLVAEGLTIPFIGKWIGPHVFIGLMPIPPVALKPGSTGYRFVRYYTHDEPYVRKGPPPSATPSTTDPTRAPARSPAPARRASPGRTPGARRRSTGGFVALSAGGAWL